MSDLTESFYQRLPAGGEMLRCEKRKRNDALGNRRDGNRWLGWRWRDSVYIRTNHRPAGTGARRGWLFGMGKTDKDLGTGRLPKTRRR